MARRLVPWMCCLKHSRFYREWVGETGNDERTGALRTGSKKALRNRNTETCSASMRRRTGVNILRMAAASCNRPSPAMCSLPSFASAGTVPSAEGDATSPGMTTGCHRPRRPVHQRLTRPHASRTSESPPIRSNRAGLFVRVSSVFPFLGHAPRTENFTGCVPRGPLFDCCQVQARPQTT